MLHLKLSKEHESVHLMTPKDADYTVTRDINLPYQFYFVYFSQLTKYHIENQFDLRLPRYNVSL